MSHNEATIGVESFGYQQELKRTLRFKDLLIYGLIFMVPIAPFGIFGQVYNGSGGMVALTYLIGMVAMMFTANSYVQMSRAFPTAGSVYTYAGRGIAPSVGFLSGWVILLDYVLIPSLLYLVAGAAMHSIVDAVPVWGWILIFITFNTFVNYMGIEFTARTNIFMLLAQIIVLGIFLVMGIVALANGAGNGFSFDPLYNPDTFSWTLIFGALSIAVLSFLGFDGISMLAEESRDGAKSIGRAMVAALFLAGALFITQTWVASLLVPNPDGLLKEASDTAFYDAAGVAGGQWLSVLTAVATAISWGFANSLVAQAATSRLLFAMARDRQLPGFLRTVHPKRQVPVNATLLTAGISVVIGLIMSAQEDGIGNLSSLVNFGALTAFLVLNVAVVVHYIFRQKSRRWFVHLVAPVIGFGILSFVVINAKVAAQVTGFVWLGIGIVVLIVMIASGRKPSLSAVATVEENEK